MINTEFKNRRARGETEIISPYKGAPPGARPIFVYGETDEILARKIADIFTAYSIYGIDEVSIYESDHPLSAHIAANKIKSSPEEILKSKGLEKTCVLWSTKIHIDTNRDVMEFIYTILTRTTAILIIALGNILSETYINVLKTLTSDREKIIVWDLETGATLDRIHSGQIQPTEEEDSDDPGEIITDDGLNSSNDIDGL